jgi:hypothetical protein
MVKILIFGDSNGLGTNHLVYYSLIFLLKSSNKEAMISERMQGPGW